MSADKTMFENIIHNMRHGYYHDQNPACDQLEKFAAAPLRTSTDGLHGLQASSDGRTHETP